MTPNGCGGKGGFKFSTLRDKIKKLPLVNPKKLDKLYYDIETKVCNPHDLAFEIGGGIIAFIKANYIFINDLLKQLHWTTTIGRLLLFITVFPLMNVLGIKYFNWKFKG